jgi:hypothetical protein
MWSTMQAAKHSLVPWAMPWVMPWAVVWAAPRVTLWPTQVVPWAT